MELSPGAWTAISGIVIAAIAALTSPQWVKRLEARDPMRGWQAAISALEDRITSQDKVIEKQEGRIGTLEDEVSTLERELLESRNTVLTKESTILGQSRIIDALTRRITQLESAWPAGLTVPPIDPAFSELLRPSGG